MLLSRKDENAAIPIANFFSLIIGFISLSALFVIESMTVFLPLLFAPMVCITLCYLLSGSYKSATESDESISVNPVKLDLI